MMAEIDIKAGQVIEIRHADRDGEIFFGVFVDRQLHDVIGPFASEAERDRAIADLRTMLTSDQRSKSVPATDRITPRICCNQERPRVQ
jgi:hypothetical protein